MIANTTPTKAAELIPGPRKCAILLLCLGEQSAAEMLKQLSIEEVQEVSREITLLGDVSPEQVEGVLQEFYELTLAREYVVKGGLEYARKMLVSAFGLESARKLLDQIAAAIGSELVSFDALQKADPQQLAKFIQSEHPQTIATIVSHLNPSQAAGLLLALPTDIRSEVALRMAHLDQISPDVITKIAAVIGQKLNSLGELSRESYGGVRAVAELLNRLDSGSSKEILDNIEQQDPNLAESVRHLMFVFEDMLLINVKGMKEVLSKVDRKLLTLALKGTSEQLQNHFIQCMSQRGAEMLREDMDSMGPVRIKDVEGAQQQIIAMVRQLEAQGVISLKGAVGEQYVV
ncbi:MAG TPA: flagellar motor switch protein FliG [Bryobacteraceae bacterium]|nr:flagellar motor switch protein FliG [Bryobacteraceae bacterium]